MMLSKEHGAWIDEQLRLLEEAIYDETGLKVALSIDGAETSLELMVDSIVRHVCNALRVPVVLLLGPSRKHHVLMARYVALYMVRLYCASPHPTALAPLFNRDRSSIIHAYEEIDNLHDTGNESFNQTLQTALSTYKSDYATS